jgi:hypothetical protein
MHILHVVLCESESLYCYQLYVIYAEGLVCGKTHKQGCVLLKI